MKKHMKRKVFIILTFLFLIGSFVYMHEAAHYNIYQKYGINDVNVTLRIDAVSMYPNETQIEELDESSYRELRLVQSFAEAIGYNLLPLFFTNLLLLVVILEKK